MTTSDWGIIKKNLLLFPLLGHWLLFLDQLDLAQGAGAFEAGLPCQPCATTSNDDMCSIDLKVNLYASETGKK